MNWAKSRRSTPSLAVRFWRGRRASGPKTTLKGGEVEEVHGRVGVVVEGFAGRAGMIQVGAVQAAVEALIIEKLDPPVAVRIPDAELVRPDVHGIAQDPRVPIQIRGGRRRSDSARVDG